MDASATLDIPLTPELRRLVAAAIASGRFASAGEAVRAGLHLLVDAGAPGNGDARLAAALRESEERLRTLADHLPNGMVYQVAAEPDGTRRFLFISAEVERLFSVTVEEAMQDASRLYRLILEDHRPRLAGAEATALASCSLFNMEVPARRPDGEVRWVQLSSAPRTLSDGSIVWDVVVLDITERVRSEERQRLLIHELNHRVKNTLATVQSLASQTLRNAGSLKDFGEKFASRLFALSAAHGLLTQGQWEHAPLCELLRNELKPYGDERFSVSGEDIQLPPRIVLPLGMVFHELATNAAKHGALSAPGGRVDVEWRVDERQFLHLKWREEGGPPAQKPAAEGFGSRLLDRTVSGELAGRYERQFRSTGLVCRITVPLPGADPAELAQRDAA